MKKPYHKWAGRLALFTLCLFAAPLPARDWSDLDEPEIHGSDREGRAGNFVIFGWEDWVNAEGKSRQSYHFFLGQTRLTWYPKYDSYMFFPLFYRRISKIDERRQTITPLFYRKYENEANDFILAPFFYHDMDGGDSTTVLGPAYYRNTIDSTGADRYHGKGIFPLFHYGWEKYSSSHEERSLLLYPLLSYFEWSQSDTLHVAPLYYRSVHEWKEGTAEARTSKTLALLSYYERNIGATWEDRSWWLLPLLYIGYGHSTPVAREEKTAAFFHLAPIFYYNSTTTSTQEGKEWGKTLVMFPSLPLLFYRYHNLDAEGKNEESSWYIFPVYHRTARNGDVESSRWITPVFARNTVGDSSTTWIFPIFYSSSDGNDGSSAVSLLPLFKHTYTEATDSSQGESSWWVFPFYWWRNDDSRGSTILPLYWYETGKKSDFAMLTPLYWSSENHETRELTRLGLPLFYYHRWPGAKQEQSTLWVLNYYEWNHADSEGRLVVPFKYHYSDRLKEYDLYIPLAVSTSQSVPEVNDGGLYLDSDFSLAYNVLSISWRAPILSRDMLKGIFRRGLVNEPGPVSPGAASPPTRAKSSEPALLAADASTATKTPPSGPTLSRGKDLDPWDRANTKAYFGWSVLFGWMSAIHADSKRHFRILPLMWLSWDEADEKDKLTYIPFAYLDYRNGDERYHAVFPAFLPLYGRYSKGETFVEDWLAILYIGSYDAETREAETSIVWPFFKKYSSPTESGVRLIPVFAHRTWQDGNVEHRRWITPVSYSITDRTRQDGDEQTESLTISPFYLSSSTEYTRRVRGVVDPKRAAESSGQDLASVSHRSAWSYCPLPLLYFGREDERTSWNLAFLFGGSGSDNDTSSSLYVLPLFYRSREATPFGDRTNLWALFLYHNVSDPSIGYSSTHIIWPLFQIWRSSDEHGWNLFPLFAWKTGKTAREKHTTHFSPFHYSHNSATTLPGQPEQGTTSSTLWALLYYGETYASRTLTETDHWFPLPFARRHQKITRPSPGCAVTETEWRLYPIFYRGTEETEAEPERNCRANASSYTFVVPLFFHFSKGNTSTDFILGYYRDSGPDHGYHNLLFLAEYEYGKDSFDAALLFKVLRLESDPRSTHFRALWGLLADWESYAPDADPKGYRGGYDFRFLNYIQRNNSRDYGPEFKTAFWPIYSYYSSEHETSFWFLPTLSYHQRKKDYRFDVALGGLAWYREYEDSANHGSNWVALGMLYYRQTRPEHDLESRGSLWGIAWNQETERATGYSKLTVAAGILFKKVEHPAGNRRYARLLLFFSLYDEAIQGDDAAIPMSEEANTQVADRGDPGKEGPANASLLPVVRSEVAGDLASADRIAAPAVPQSGASPALARF